VHTIQEPYIPEKNATDQRIIKEKASKEREMTDRVKSYTLQVLSTDTRPKVI
jgi:hypothetical protein